MRHSRILAAALCACSLQAVAQAAYRVGNRSIIAHWSVQGGHVSGFAVDDLRAHRRLQFASPFALALADGSVVDAASLQMDGAPVSEALPVNASASRRAEQLPGTCITTHLRSADDSLHVDWTVLQRDGSDYLREEVTLRAPAHDVAIRRVQMIDVFDPGARVVGSVKGSPIVIGGTYAGFEHPLSESNVAAEHATAYLDRTLPLRAGTSVTYSAVVGSTRPGQLRRDFLTYLERERAHPYRTFLHYNTWYDLGFFNAYDEAGALDRIHAIGTELHDKRGVTLDSFLFDDGWDSHSSLWSFHSGFPNGFATVRKELAAYGAAPGVWLSPWGGYGPPKQERLKYGTEQGFETVKNGFALSGPKYFRRFEDACLDMVRRYGVNQFKFDGTGNADSVFKGSAYDSDFDAAIHLIGDLRQAKPDLFINLTTGTYPSPFWLSVADSIWRGGEDDDVAGVGPWRERWITYRDADTYDRVVKAGPLYPLNSLMLHGLIFAERHKHLREDPSGSFRNEVRSYFGTGTQTQEMYITPSLLSPANWDDLAEAARWSRSNAGVLVDTHWVGGDPRWLQPYGWASWSHAKSILTLRNPDRQARSIALDVAAALQVPAGETVRFRAHSPWKSDATLPGVDLHGGSAHVFQLQPFEVLTLELQPVRVAATRRVHRKAAEDEPDPDLLQIQFRRRTTPEPRTRRDQPSS